MTSYPVKYKGLYRRSSTRLPYWDYSSNAAYFVTICTDAMIPYFGEVRNGYMSLNELGCAAAACWQEIPKHFPFVVADAFVVMPNHVHGIVVIRRDDKCRKKDVALDVGDGGVRSDARSCVATPSPADVGAGTYAVTDPHHGWTPNTFGPQSRNLAFIIRGFKIGVTKFAKQHAIEFLWQAKYHDHIIRSEEKFFAIRQYIQNNPAKWWRDRNNHEKMDS